MTGRDLALLALAATAALAGAAGWHLGRAPLLAAIERARADHAIYRATVAETHKLQALASARALQAEQTHSAALRLRLSQQLSTIHQLRKDRNEQAIRSTTGRACLSADTVRVLNTPAAAGGAAPADLPATAHGTDGAHAPATAAPGAAAPGLTDTDVAAWVTDAQAQYAACAARLNTLIDWAAHRPNAAP